MEANSDMFENYCPSVFPEKVDPLPSKYTCVVNVVGLAGSGKTTIIPLIAKELERLGGGQVKCKLADRLKIKDVFLTLIRKPKLILLAYYLKLSTKEKKQVLSGTFNWIIRLAKGAQYTDSCSTSNHDKHTILFYDQGLVHFLRKIKPPLPVSLFEKIPLPDIVIYINVNHFNAFERRAKRSKPLKNKDVLKGKKRFEKAIHYIDRFKYNISENQLLKVLHLWSLKFCKPPISEEDLTKLIRNPYHKNEIKKKKAVRPAVELKNTLKTLGVHWIDVHNNDTDSLDESSKVAAKQVWGFLKTNETFSQRFSDAPSQN